MLQPGVVLAEQYELIALLGSGGQGSVWLARERASGAERALKILDLSKASSTARERAQREAEQLVKLRHPTIVQCFWLVIEPRLQLVVLVLEYVRGRSLAERAADPRLTAARRMDVLVRVAEALAHAHASSVVHRDVKPQNILLSEDFFAEPHRPDTVRLVDFGIAVPTGNPDPLTREDRAVGTRAYMAPEQIDPRTWGDHPDAPTLDVFAWGILAWELLVGGHPSGLPAHASSLDLVDAYRKARASDGRLALPVTPWTALIAPALALDPRERLRDGNALCRHLRQASGLGCGTTEVPMTDAETAPAAASVAAPAVTPALPAVTTGVGAALGARPPREPRGTGSRLLLVSVLLALIVGGVAAAAAVFIELHESPWKKFVRTCCAKSPEYAGHTCPEAGVNLTADERWWIRFQWATDGAKKNLHSSHPNAEVCAKPARAGATCWPASPPSPAQPLEVTTDDLASGSLQIWIREQGPEGTVVIDRMITRYDEGLTTGVLCRGLVYTKSTMSKMGMVVFSVEPVDEELSKYRGF